MTSADNFLALLDAITHEDIHQEEFNVEYFILEGDKAGYPERRSKVKSVGYRIEGEPNFNTPSITYAIATFEGTWYFGTYKEHDHSWQKHKQKPRSFSNSISMNIAKTLVSIASTGDKDKNLLDVCCGVGTIMLEACFNDIRVEGCDINWSACKHTRENLAHFGYTATVYCQDIKELAVKYDAAIVDLPYNLYSYSNDDIVLNIVESTAELTNRVVIVSITDITSMITKAGLTITDSCTVGKPGKSKFVRKLWICKRL